VSKGKLIVCSNHTGNLDDIPLRTIEAIKKNKHIFCEFFYRLKQDILDHHQIELKDKEIIEFQENSEHKALALSILSNGNNLVLISEHGLPGVADDGLWLIDFVYNNGYDVEIIPGPSILPTALAFSGIPSQSTDIYFLQLFGRSEKDKRRRIKEISNIDTTIVVLDFSYEIEKLISIFNEELDGDRIAALCINIGMPGQKIIRESLSKLKNKKLSLKENYKDIICVTTLVIQSISKTVNI
jgi:16S rRNA (cytidine1402-2'-O)-methyltransferase